MTFSTFSTNFTRFTRQAWRNSVLYRFTLMSGATPKHLTVMPTDPWPGDIYKGHMLLDGKFIFGNQIISVADLWMPPEADSNALKDLHQFTWLRDLRALGDNFARRLARQLITNWIDRNQDWKLLSWQPAITGQRVANWIALYDFFCSSADDSFRGMFFREIARQVRHLVYTWEEAPTPFERLSALKGIIYAAVTFPGESSRLAALLVNLEKEVNAQILSDGGHMSRSPQIHLTVLRDLIDIRAMLRLIQHEIPTFLQATINQMAPIVRLFRHGDGGLATFGADSQISPPVIDMALSLADVRGRPPERAQILGFERCVNKSSLILLNVGSKVSGIDSELSDESTGSLNFEWSIGRDRVVLQGDIIIQTQEGQNFQIPDLIDHSKSIQLHRANQEGHTFVDVRYGQSDAVSFSHRRQLCLGGSRLNLRGEDTIQVPTEAVYGIRFVLDKEIEASLSSGNRGVILRIPNSGKPSKDQGGEQWRFLVSGAQEILLESHGDYQAILLLGCAKRNEPTSVQWAFCQD